MKKKENHKEKEGKTVGTDFELIKVAGEEKEGKIAKKLRLPKEVTPLTLMVS